MCFQFSESVDRSEKSVLKDCVQNTMYVSVERLVSTCYLPRRVVGLIETFDACCYAF